MHVTVQDASVSIGERAIFSGVSFDAPVGSTVALVGASGSGKTTLLNCVGMLVRLSGGRIRLDDKDVTRATTRRRCQLWRDKITFVFQDYGLIDDDTVARNVSLGQAPLLNRRRRKDERVERALNDVGLPGRSGDYVTKLSGGERQRVGIARALYRRSTLILADEPTASLDRANREHVQGLLLDTSSHGATVIVATHDETLASVCDIVVELGSRLTPNCGSQA